MQENAISKFFLPYLFVDNGLIVDDQKIFLVRLQA